jgi:predicted transcriptional regulator
VDCVLLCGSGARREIPGQIRGERLIRKIEAAAPAGRGGKRMDAERLLSFDADASAAQLPRPEALRMEAARLIKSKIPHSMVEVKDLQSGDVTAVALRPG